ncbi:MAG: ribosomal protein S18-alanine N-acetyltransferase [Deltaproteobacteria bacterium]|nr:ribosomal protein S18-alanine N-acetyltransferase [Deltaproteobacteria bacterium]
MDPDRIRISEITEADLRDVLTIEGLSFSTPWNEEMFKSELYLDFAHNFSGKLNSSGNGDILVGYICSWLFHGEAHILNIAVHPDYRRMGLGTYLMRFFCEFCLTMKVKTITLDVRSSNHPAIKMYRKMGFRKLGLRPHYYADNGEDALIMGLKLNGR